MSITKPIITNDTGRDIAAALNKLVLVQEYIAGGSVQKHIEDWGQVSDMVKDGTAEIAFPVGTQFVVPWTDVRQSVDTVYQMPFDVVHYGDVTLKDGEVVRGMYLQSHYCLPFGTPFDAAEPENANGNVKQYGSNVWAESNVRQFLNGTKAYSATSGSGWWTQTTDTDVLSTSYNNVNGFLTGFGDDFVGVLADTKQVTQRNNVDQAGENPDALYDKVFLPSAEQHYLNTYLGTTQGVEGEYWEYWKRVSGSATPFAGWATHTEYIQYDLASHTSACYSWLRSASRYNSYSAGIVYSNGLCSNNAAYYASRVAPACVIC